MGLASLDAVLSAPLPSAVLKESLSVSPPLCISLVSALGEVAESVVVGLLPEGFAPNSGHLFFLPGSCNVIISFKLFL